MSFTFTFIIIGRQLLSGRIAVMTVPSLISSANPRKLCRFHYLSLRPTNKIVLVFICIQQLSASVFVSRFLLQALQPTPPLTHSDCSNFKEPRNCRSLRTKVNSPLPDQVYLVQQPLHHLHLPCPYEYLPPTNPNRLSTNQNNRAA